MPKCGLCGHEETIPITGRTVSRVFGGHPDARDRKKTCPGGKLVNGARDPETGEVNWFSEPKWTSANPQ